MARRNTVGAYPVALMFDPSGNLIGGSLSGPTYELSGTVYMPTRSGDNWTYNLLYADPNNPNGGFGGAIGTLVMDPAGSLYGTTPCDRNGNHAPRMMARFSS